MKIDDKEYKIINSRDENKRSRYWCIELYPDSADPDWLHILKSLGVKCVVSPLHEHDKYEDKERAGETKKPHYHILFNFNYGARLSDIVNIIDSIKAYQHCQIVKDCEIMYDYLTHKRDPDKYQYDPKDIIHINCERYDFLNSEYKEILNYIDDHKIYSFSRLTKRLRNDDQDRLLLYAARNPYYINLYLMNKTDDTESHLQSLLKQIVEIYYNIDENRIDSNEELNAIKREIDGYIDDDLPF